MEPIIKLDGKVAPFVIPPKKRSTKDIVRAGFILGVGHVVLPFIPLNKSNGGNKIWNKN